jgi:cysteine dioxygenase
MTAMISTELVRTFDAICMAHAGSFRARARFDAIAYRRELVERTVDYELWLLSWLPGQATPIHDHGGVPSTCELLAGRLLEESFLAHPTGLVACGTCERFPGGRHIIASDAIHRVCALTPAISLHLYTPAAVDGRIYEAA